MHFLLFSIKLFLLATACACARAIPGIKPNEFGTDGGNATNYWVSSVFDALNKHLNLFGGSVRYGCYQGYCWGACTPTGEIWTPGMWCYLENFHESGRAKCQHDNECNPKWECTSVCS